MPEAAQPAPASVPWPQVRALVVRSGLSPAGFASRVGTAMNRVSTSRTGQASSVALPARSMRLADALARSTM